MCLIPSGRNSIGGCVSSGISVFISSPSRFSPFISLLNFMSLLCTRHQSAYCPSLSFFYSLSLFKFFSSILSFLHAFFISVFPFPLFSNYFLFVLFTTLLFIHVLVCFFVSVAILTNKQAVVLAMLATFIYTQISSLLTSQCHVLFAVGGDLLGSRAESRTTGFYPLGRRTLESV